MRSWQGIAAAEAVPLSPVPHPEYISPLPAEESETARGGSKFLAKNFTKCLRMSRGFRTFVLCKGKGGRGPRNVKQGTAQHDAEAYATGCKAAFHT